MSLPVVEQLIDAHAVELQNSLTLLSQTTEAAIEALESQTTILQVQVDTDPVRASMALAMSGWMELAFPEDGDEADITAAALNAAAAGTLQRTFTVYFQTPEGTRHEWCSIQPVITPHETCTDPQISAPTVYGTPLFASGELEVTLTFDTDAGATKVYQAGDVLTCDVQISAADEWFSVAVAPVTMTYNVT